MAKCDLSIELDDPKKLYLGGQMITGVVRVRTDAGVTCNGLDVSSGWKTHGRGNIATGIASTARVFTGEWTAGEDCEYRFELPIADWPPTYHGHYMNVDHYIDVRANIPWAFDPKASVPFMMRPSGDTEVEIKHSGVTELSGMIGCVVAAIAVTIFLGVGAVMAFVFAPFGLLLLLGMVGVTSIGGLFWLFKVFLPKYLLGDVLYHLDETTVSPGGTVSGELVIRPRKNVPINAISMLFQAREQCVSGSGSNRTTHKNVFFEKSTTLQEATTLSAGKEHRFAVSFELPDDAPYSIDLDDNDLIWSATMRVDIPRWPDWKKELAVTVVPSGDPNDGSKTAAAQNVVAPQAIAAPTNVAAPAASSSTPQGSDGGSGITFGETIQHIWDMREDREQVEMLVEAVSGLAFEMEVMVERRLLFTGDEDPHLYENGYAVWAHAIEPALPMVLYVPHELADEFENIGRDRWRGRGTIVGWESSHRRLQVKIDRP